MSIEHSTYGGPPPKFEIDPRYLWHKFVNRAGGNPKVADDAYTVLQKLYGEEHRSYHTLGHVLWCIDLLQEFFPERGTRPDWYNRVELALWFHDIVYDPRRKDNEQRSARVLTGVTALLDIDPRLSQDAAWDVEATTHRKEDEGLGIMGGPPVPRQWVLDLDLASLGFEPAKFDKNSEQIREEYSFVPEDVYRAGRKAVLQGFLDRPRIYYTEACSVRFEHQARANLQKAVRALGG